MNDALILQNQIAIMEFLLYPNSPEKLIEQRNKTEKELYPNDNKLKQRRDIKTDSIKKGCGKCKECSSKPSKTKENLK